MEPTPKTVVPENVLRRRKRTEQVQAERKERMAELAKKKKKTTGTIFKKASEFVKEYCSMERNSRRIKKELKRPLVPEVSSDTGLLLVVRTGVRTALDTRTRDILRRLRLTQVQTRQFMVFVF